MNNAKSGIIRCLKRCGRVLEVSETDGGFFRMARLNGWARHYHGKYGSGFVCPDCRTPSKGRK